MLTLDPGLLLRTLRMCCSRLPTGLVGRDGRVTGWGLGGSALRVGAEDAVLVGAEMTSDAGLLAAGENAGATTTVRAVPSPLGRAMRFALAVTNLDWGLVQSRDVPQMQLTSKALAATDVMLSQSPWRSLLARSRVGEAGFAQSTELESG